MGDHIGFTHSNVLNAQHVVGIHYICAEFMSEQPTDFGIRLNTVSNPNPLLAVANYLHYLTLMNKERNQWYHLPLGSYKGQLRWLRWKLFEDRYSAFFIVNTETSTLMLFPS